MNYIKPEKKQQIKTLVIIFLMTVFYMLFRHCFRPVLLHSTEGDVIRLLLNVFPNFWGAIILYLFSKNFLNYNFWKSSIYVLLLSIIYEFLEIHDFNTHFDIYDIFATFIAVVCIYFFELFLDKK